MQRENGGRAGAFISLTLDPCQDNFHISRLTMPMRNAADPEFYLYVDSIREDAEGCCNIVLQHLPTILDA